MKKLISILAVGLLLALACAAQNSPVTIVATPQPPSITTVTNTGATGSTSYCYWVVAVYTGGKSAPAGPVCTNISNATLSATNYNTVNWLAPTSPLASVSSFDVLRTTSATVPTGACACAVATSVSSSAVTENDQSNSLSAYTVATASTLAQLYVDNSTALTPSLTINIGGTKTVLPKQAGSLPAAQDCGAHTGGTATCSNNAITTAAFAIFGTSTLASNAQVVTFSPGFTSTSTYACVANDITTRANPVQMVQTSATTATITNTTGAADAVEWICIGY